jgi:hypothetical protein
MMNVNSLMVAIHVNVLHIQLSKYHDNDDPVIHIRQLTKVYVTNELCQNYDIYQHLKPIW